MADIATIVLNVNTSSLEQGDKALDHFGQTAEKATKQADGLNESNTKLASSYDEAAKSLAKITKRQPIITKALSVAPNLQKRPLPLLRSKRLG